MPPTTHTPPNYINEKTRMPLSLVITLVAGIVGAAWFTATVKNDISNLKDSHARVEKTTTEISQRMSDLVPAYHQWTIYDHIEWSSKFHERNPALVMPPIEKRK